MEYVNSNDLFEIRLNSILTDFDRKIICELYQPITGFSAMSLFFTMWSKYERKMTANFVSHSLIFNAMQMNPREFTSAKRKLEAIGLLRTFVKEEDGVKKYTYVLYAPKSPNAFFDDVLFTGLLTKYIGEDDAFAIANSFKQKDSDLDGQEVSTSFVDEFNPDFNDSCYMDNKLCRIDTYDRKTRNVDTKFDFVAFYAQIEADYGLMKTQFSKNDNIEIERLSALYGIDELTMSDLVHQTFDGKKTVSKRIDYKQLDQLCQNENRITTYSFKKKNQKKVSNTDCLNDNVRNMEEMSCKDFLVSLQHGCKASSADLKIISDLSSEFSLTPNSINAIIYYTLQKCNNKLPRAFIDKVASCVVRMNLETAADTYQYLTNDGENLKDDKNISLEHEKNTVVTGGSAPVCITNNDDEIDDNLAARLRMWGK